MPAARRDYPRCSRTSAGRPVRMTVCDRLFRAAGVRLISLVSVVTIERSRQRAIVRQVYVHVAAFKGSTLVDASCRHSRALPLMRPRSADFSTHCPLKSSAFASFRLSFDLAFVFRCDLIKNESKPLELNGRSPGEASVGSDFRPRHHRRRHQRLRHRARRGGPRQHGFPVRNERSGERDVVLVDQAGAWRPALSRILRVSAGPRGADRARDALGHRAPHHPPAAFRFAAPCRACGRPGCCASGSSSTTTSAAVICCRRRARSILRATRSAGR